MNQRNGPKRRRNSCTTIAARGGIVATLFVLLLLYFRLVSTTIRIHQDKPLVNKQLPVVHDYEFLKGYEQHHDTNNNNNTTNQLEFIHISKTGGTAIERAAARAGISWGVCHYQALPEICNRVRPNLGWPQTFALRTDIVIPYAANFTHAEYWHTPLHWFVHNPYEGRDTFTVVRNPYDRYISEYYCPYFGYYSNQTRFASNKTNSPLLLSNNNNRASDRVARFQQLAKERIAFKERKRRHDVTVDKNKDRRRLLHTSGNNHKEERMRLNTWLWHRIRNYQGWTGHLLPQYYYVYDANGTKLVTHVLRYETLPNDFDVLMKRYHLPISLPTHHVNTGYPKNKERLTQKDLSKQVIQAINDFCRLDFEKFGYDMMDPSSIEFFE